MSLTIGIPVQDHERGYVKFSLEVANPGEDGSVEIEGCLQICDTITATPEDAILKEVCSVIRGMWSSAAIMVAGGK